MKGMIERTGPLQDYVGQFSYVFTQQGLTQLGGFASDR